MSHYKPYSNYKDSGVEWIGRVPEHWTVSKLAYVTNERGGKTPDTGNPAFWDGGIPWVSPKDMKSDEIVGTIDTISELAVRNCGMQVIEPGAVLAVVRGMILAHSFPVAELRVPATLNQDMKALQPSDAVQPTFLRLLLQGAKAYVVSVLVAEAAHGTRVLRTDIWRQLPALLPPTSEQVAITAALDRETARIDALIAKKARFIELLKEKRQARITHAVTKGLGPTVRMKDSGVDWIGEVPERWEVLPSTWLFVESNERAHDDDEHLSATQKYGVIPLAEYERLEARQVTHAVKNLEQRKHVEIDNFVISMRSFEGGIERVKARGCVRSSYVVLLPEARADVGFYAYLLKSSTYIQGLQATASFIRDGQDLSYGNFRQVKLPVPSIEEQRVIAQYLDKSIARIDSLTGMTERSIALLKERRSALITAAVTGQIDLRAPSESKS